MTITEPAVYPPIEPVGFEIYRDIHKGIRTDLFAATTGAGTLDPSDAVGRRAVADHVQRLGDFLVEHAEHEDAVILPVLRAELPELGERIASDHTRIDGRIETLRDLADAAHSATATEQRFRVHQLYIELASFTAAFLEHQDFEERVVARELEAKLGVETAMGLHGSIIASLSPEEMVQSMSIMLPAMNVDDRAAMWGGMRANAPAEVFGGIWNLAGSVLDPADVRALAGRLGL